MSTTLLADLRQLELFSVGKKPHAQTAKLTRPFLKWAGGKFRVLPHILPSLGTGKRLVEPFAGSGAVFLNSTGFDEYLICDTNMDLIALFKAIQKSPTKFIKNANSYFVARNRTEKQFKRLRETFNLSKDPYERAVLFVYLNRHCYNGLCRYNSSGHFNVPYGHYVKPYFPLIEIEHFAQVAKRAIFKNWEFEDTFTNLKKGDVVYADPPYVPLSTTASFTAYAPGGFNIRQHEKLAELAEYVVQKQSVRVLISNHATTATRRLYSGSKQPLLEFSVRRMISCVGSKRHPAKELLAIYE